MCNIIEDGYKMKDGGQPPRITTIAGQKHMLAYITPEEGQVLKNRGGAGKPGPMGIMSFYDEGDDYSGIGGDQAAQADGTQGLAPSSFVGESNDAGYDKDGKFTGTVSQVTELGQFYNPNNDPNVLAGFNDVFVGGGSKAPTQAFDNFFANKMKSPGTKISQGIKSLFGMSPVMNVLNSIFGKKKSGPNSAQDDVLGEMSDILGYAGKNPNSVSLSDDGLGMSITTPNGGTINVGKSGFTTYTGMPDPDYDGPFQDLVNPPPDKNDDEQTVEKTPLDPCPEGYKFNQETQSCEKVEDTDEDEVEDKNEFTRNPTPISVSYPDLSKYGQKPGDSEYMFFSSMPGVQDPQMKSGGIPRLKAGEVKGPGGPKDDLVGPFMLSNKEYVLPYEQVLAEGNGSYSAGIKTLERERKAALKKYANRTRSA